MATILLTMIIMILVVAGMAIGLLRNKPIQGTCASIASLGMGEKCDICGSDRTRCNNPDAPKSDEKVPVGTVEKNYYKAD